MNKKYIFLWISIIFLIVIFVFSSKASATIITGASSVDDPFSLDSSIFCVMSYSGADLSTCGYQSFSVNSSEGNEQGQNFANTKCSASNDGTVTQNNNLNGQTNWSVISCSQQYPTCNYLTLSTTGSNCYSNVYTGSTCQEFTSGGQTYHKTTEHYSTTCNFLDNFSNQITEITGQTSCPVKGASTGGCPRDDSGAPVNRDFGFNIDVTPPARVINKGDTTTYAVYIDMSLSVNAFSYGWIDNPYPIPLYVANANELSANNISVSFSPSEIRMTPDSPTGWSTLVVSTNSNTQVGDYVLNICGKNGNHCDSVTLSVVSGSEMVCDSQWYPLPPNNAISGKPVLGYSGGSNPYVSVAYSDIGGSNYYTQRCVYGSGISNECSWIGAWSPWTISGIDRNGDNFKIDQISSDLYLEGSTVYVSGKDGSNGNNFTAKFDGGWSDIDYGGWSWGTPQSVVDGNGRIIKVSKNSSGLVSYQCILQSGNAPTLSVDMPSEGETINGTKTLAGWAVDTLSRSETKISKIEIYVDGNLLPSNKLRKVARNSTNDICDVNRFGINWLDCPNAGFEYSWDTTSVGNGSHTIKFVAYDSDTDLNGNPNIHKTEVTKHITVSNAGILGRVYRDNNGNGSRDSDEPYVSNMINPSCASRVNTQLFVTAKNTSTNKEYLMSVGCDSDGSLYSGMLPPGNYTVSVTKPINPLDSYGWKVSEPSTTSYNVTLSAGEERHLWFGLQPPAGILGRVYRDDNGSGLYESGETWILSPNTPTTSCGGTYDNSQNISIQISGDANFTLPVASCDSTGSYYGFNMPAGNYTIKASVPSGWTVSEPVGNTRSFYAKPMASDADNVTQWFGFGVSCPSGPTSYPNDYWDRVWCDKDFTQKLSDTPDQPIEQFSDGWGGVLVAGKSDQVGFRSGKMINFATSGNYKFTVGADDGIRVWIDGNLIPEADKWFDQGYTEYTFTRYMTSGRHQFRIDYYENLGWGGVSFKYARVNDATCNGISAPDSVSPGNKFSATVTMNNTGVNTWTLAGNYNLGSQNSQDNYRWGRNRTYLPNGTLVSPGQTATFTFESTAPTTEGSYPFDWKMVLDGVEWFGGTCTKTISVSNGGGPCNLNVVKTYGGHIESDNGSISCGSNCSKSYTCGSTVTLTAVPDSGQWKFVGWQGDCSGSSNYSITVDGNKTCTAVFSLRPFKYEEF